MGCIDVSHLGEVEVEPAEIAAHLRIADGAAWVEFFLDIASQSLADFSQRVLVAQAPYQYRGMVLVAPDGGLCALLQYGIECLLRQVLVAIAEGYLIDDIKAERVGKLIEARFSWIVRRADIVYRCLFHQAHVLQCQFVADNLRRLGVCAVASHSTQFYWLSVQFKNLSVDGQFPESELVLECLQGLSLAAECCAQCI